MYSRIVHVLSARANIVTGVVFLAGWSLISTIWQPMWLPTPVAVIRELVKLIEEGALGVLGNTGVTLLIGLVATLLVCGIVATLMASSEVIEKTLLPYVNGFLAVPHIALIPMFTFIWGSGDFTRIITVASFVISPVILIWATALKAVPENLNEMALAFGASRSARIRYVRMPDAAAPLVAGLRLGVVQGIKGVVSAEVIIGVVGIGKLITTASYTFNLAQVYAIVLMIIASSIISYVLLTALENRMTRWNE